MSKTNSVKPLKMENVLDPRLNCMDYVQDEMKWGIFKGAEGQNQVHQQANSYSTSGITWNFNTQSETTLIDRRLYAKVQFLMTFNGTSPIGQPLLLSENDAPRAFPLASITNSLKVTINGQSVETQYADALQALLRYNCEHDIFNYDLSQTPNALDRSQQYAELVGTVRNPLSNYDNNSYEMGRGTVELDVITNPASADGVTPTVSVVKFTVVEPLLISPLLYKSNDLQSALVGVKNMGVQFNFSSGQLARVWSHNKSSGATITSAVCSIGAGSTEPPLLLVNYLTPPLVDLGELPKSVNYQYYKTDTFVNDQNVALAPNASQSFTNNAIQLSTVPKSIYIYASLPNSDRTFETTDTFFRINSLSLNYLNVSGQFSSMNSNDLYNMSVKNGLKMNWIDWNGKSTDITSTNTVNLAGGVLRIDISDLNIPSNMASGVNTNSQLSYTINLTNLDTVNKNVSLTTLLTYDGLMTIENNNMMTQIGVIDTNDVLQTRMSGNWIDWKSANSIYGGNMFSRLGSFIHSVSKGVKNALPVAKDIMEVKKMLGYGQAGALVGGQKKQHSKRGGKMMSRDELRDRMFD